jgi:hypothetical protein
MKIFTTTILFTFIIFYNSNAIAETKRDCSMYSSKTHVGMLEKRRCKKGLPQKEKTTLGQKLKKLNPFKKKK